MVKKALRDAVAPVAALSGVQALIEQLEPRRLLSTAYSYAIVAENTGAYASFGNGPGINDSGTVAFVGKQTVGDGVYVGSGAVPATLVTSQFSGDSSRTFNQTAQINNTGQIAAQQRLAGSTIRSFIFNVDSTNPGSATQLASGDGGGTGDFSGVNPFPSINNNGAVIFGAFDVGNGPTQRYLVAGTSGTGFATSNVTGTPQPMVADNGNVVAKSGNAANSPIRLYDSSLGVIGNINPGDFFNVLGAAPGISDDGSVVAFYGELPFGNIDIGTNSGPGIFISVDIGGGTRVVRRVMGTSGDGILDPGEAWEDTNRNATVDVGEDSGGITSFSADTRVGVQYRTDDPTSLNITFIANNSDSAKTLYVMRVDSADPSAHTFKGKDPVALATVGKKAQRLSGNVTDVNIFDPVNSAGQVAYWVSSDSGQQAIMRVQEERKPVFIVPGIAGTFGSDLLNPSSWLTNRGVHPDQLLIDPLEHVYDDLIQTFRNAGYIDGQDLFVVKYDWRLTPGPEDGVLDGHVSGITADSVSDTTFTHGVDYFGYYLRQAQTSWRTRFGSDLDSVHAFAHSTGGLVTRTYIQSDAYGATTTDNITLPRVDDFIELAVPNRGSPLAFGPLVDNWTGDVGLRVLKTAIHNAYYRVLAGQTINGPTPINFFTILTNGNPDPLKFIKQYVPTIRSLVATYDFVDNGDGVLRDINDTDNANLLAIDLNNGLDKDGLNPVDPSPFLDLCNATIVYGTSETSKTSAIKITSGEILSFTTPGPIGRPLLFFESTYANRATPASGDETVPIISGAGQFLNDPRATLAPFATTGQPSEGASHTAIPSNRLVQRKIFETIGVPIDDSQISTTLARRGPSVLALFLDPVGAVLTDANGRRLGWTEQTGQLAEIPGSVMVGTTDGFGIVYGGDAGGAIVGPLTLTLTGAGADYRAWVEMNDGTQQGRLASEGFLAQGEVRTLSIPLQPAGTVANPVGGDDAISTPVGTAVQIPVLNNDTASPGSTIVAGTVSILNGAVNGSLAVDAETGVITITPAAGFEGVNTFTYSFRDSSGATGSAQVTVTVGSGVNPNPNPNPNPDPGVLAVTRFILVDANTDQDIRELSAGATINLAEFGKHKLTIRAVTGTIDATSVRFGFDEKPRKFKSKFATDSTSPFALFGGSASDYKGKAIKKGSHKITATPFTLAKGKGDAGNALTVNFSVVDQPIIASLQFIDAEHDLPLFDLTDGQIITAASLGTSQFNVRAFASKKAKSIVFDLDGATRFSIESDSIFALFKNKKSDYFAGAFAPGAHTITATAYSKTKGKGSAGVPLTVTFTVV